MPNGHFLSLAAALVVLLLALTAGVAAAKTINGTAKGERLNGTSGADRISGRGSSET